jgi:hypothetical protein
VELEPMIGQSVSYVDSHGVERSALVTAVFPGMQGQMAGINVVYVSGDESRKDGCGRQIERATSVCHQSAQPAHGNYWRVHVYSN